MRHFLILFDDFPIDAASVKSGNNSQEVITASRCVNVALFISGNLRRDVVISLAKGSPDDLKIVTFNGATLKRVSPDERSISFFLMKAVSIADELGMDSLEKMDNGIETRRSSLQKFLEPFGPTSIYLSTSDNNSISMDEAEYQNSILIYSEGKQINLDYEKVTWTKLPFFPHPERFILDINMIMDMKKAS
jgi:tRNA pseudouridine-54 N-methylase